MAANGEAGIERTGELSAKGPPEFDASVAHMERHAIRKKIGEEKTLGSRLADDTSARHTARGACRPREARRRR